MRYNIDTVELRVLQWPRTLSLSSNMRTCC